MTPDEILARLGWPDGSLELVESLQPPPDTVARGFAVVVDAELPPAHFTAVVESAGLSVSRYLDDPRCILVEGTPGESGGNVRSFDGETVLDTRGGGAWAVFPVGSGFVVAYGEHGELHILRSVDPFVEQLSARSSRPAPFQLEFPSIANLTSVGTAPGWLADAAYARWSDEPTDKLEAIGLVARHGRGASTQLARAWSSTLPARDVAFLESWIDAEIESAYELLEETIESDSPAVMARLVLRRERLASLAAIRSLIGVGSGIQARLHRFDAEVEDHILHLPSPDRVGPIRDEALRAAGDFNPDAWWSSYGS